MVTDNKVPSVTLMGLLSYSRGVLGKMTKYMEAGMLERAFR